MNVELENEKRQGASSPPALQRAAAKSADRPSGPRPGPPLPVAEKADNALRRVSSAVRHRWESPRVRMWRQRTSTWRAQPYSGTIVLLAGTALITLLMIAVDQIAVPLPNPGVVYLPLIAMLAYHWSWRQSAAAALLQLACVYYFFIPPAVALKPLPPQGTEQLATLVLVDAFILALVRLARTRRDLAEREAQRFAALNTVGTALASELNEERLLRLIAQTARDLTGAGFAAFTLRPLDPAGHPLVPADGSLFHLAAVVGVTPEQEALFQRMPLGGEGLLAPIFRHGVAVRVADALTHTQPAHGSVPAPAREMPTSPDDSGRIGAVSPSSRRDSARAQAASYAHGESGVDSLHGIGVPRGHPIVRSFLGAPLFDRNGQVRGGLLLGHAAPGRFTDEDEMLLQALAAQASVVLENARLYQSAQTQARELDAVFESIADGVTVVDTRGVIRHENRAAAAIRAAIPASVAEAAGSDGANALTPEVRVAVAQVLAGEPVGSTSVTLEDATGERRGYLVGVSPLRTETVADSQLRGDLDGRASTGGNDGAQEPGAVIVWHDVTETRKLLAERQARSQAEAQRTLLQMVIDELPSGVYLVRGRDARLVLANRAAMDVWGATWPVGEPMTSFLASSGTQIVGAGGQVLSPDELATLRSVNTGAAVRHHQEIIRRPDGTALPALLNAVALDSQILDGLLAPNEAHAADGAAATQQHAEAEPAALIVLQDVTALKEAERLKDEFIAIAAHELKTPMAAVKGYADMLMRQSERDEQARLADWQSEALETIDQATSRLVELTNDLLDVTRIQAHRMELHPEPHDLVALARRVVKRFQVTTDRHRLSVEVEGSVSAADYVVASLDVPRAEQVLGNLLSNAIKYSPDGGAITVVVREDAARGMAELCVQDTGIGIPGEQHAQLFHRFARAHNARELGIAGTGLGLYLCRELVELQGGRIWFTSAEGQGTTFYVTLPLAATE